MREPLPVTLTLSLEERVLPREFDRTELGAVTGVRADDVVLVVDWDLIDAEEDLSRAVGDGPLGDILVLDLTLAKDARETTTFFVGVVVFRCDKDCFCDATVLATEFLTDDELRVSFVSSKISLVLSSPFVDVPSSRR